MTFIDLNADLGESFGAYTIGSDTELLQIVSSANIACGFHGGDPSVMAKTIRMAKRQKVRVGAHPGFNDLAGFGRRVIRGDSPASIRDMILYQIGAFQALAQANGAQMSYVKLHGALSNMAMTEAPLADAFIEAITALNSDIPVMAMPLSAVKTAAKRENIGIIYEAFADRAYLADGMLVPRSHPDAMIHDARFASDRVLRMINDNCIIALDGSKIPVNIDSICVHGDNPEAIRIAECLRHDLERAGVTIAPTPIRNHHE
ncbi:MAG: LamB/YcsF family protein [Rhodobacteraceae bacterium]|nr:LamB/YcsF family protein [Paracoccaceae bacterium]